MLSPGLLIAEVERGLAEFGAAEEQIRAGLAQRTSRQQTGASLVYSLRLDPGEVAALERRAAVVGLKRAALARTETALNDLRALLG